MATGEIPDQLDLEDEPDEAFEERIKGTPIDRVVREGGIMTERPLDIIDDDDTDPETPPVVPPSLLDEEPLEEDDDTD